MQQGNKIGTSFRLSPTAIELIAQLAAKFGLSQAGIVELAVRKLAEAEGIKVESIKTEGNKEHGND